MKGETKKDHDGDITLIDLIAVVLRYRSVMILFPALIGAVAALVLFVAPLIGLPIGYAPAYAATQRIVVGSTPPMIEEYLPIDPSALMKELLAQQQVESMVEERTTGGLDSDGRTRINMRYTYRVMAPTEASAIQSINDIVESVTASFRDEMKEAIGVGVTSVDNAIASSSVEGRRFIDSLTTEFEEQDSYTIIMERYVAESAVEITRMMQQRELLRQLANSPESLYAMTGPPRITRDTGFSRSAVLVGSVLGSIVAALFLSFLLEYIRRVRHDPLEIEKIKSAIGK